MCIHVHMCTLLCGCQRLTFSPLFLYISVFERESLTEPRACQFVKIVDHQAPGIPKLGIKAQFTTADFLQGYLGHDFRSSNCITNNLLTEPSH